MSKTNKLEFYWRDGCIQLHACPKRLVRFHPDEDNVTIDVVKFEPKPDGSEYCYSIGYFWWNANEPCWELKFVGDRFKDIPPEQASEVWKQLGMAYDVLTEWKGNLENEQARRNDY